jgi:archaellum component FlaC
MTLGMGLSACVCLLGAGGVAIKAKNDVEYANQRQDAEIANLKERISDLRETVNEIRNDVKTLIRRTP